MNEADTRRELIDPKIKEKLERGKYKIWNFFSNQLNFSDFLKLVYLLKKAYKSIFHY